jgi:hypothetical protein
MDELLNVKLCLSISELSISLTFLFIYFLLEKLINFSKGKSSGQKSSPTIPQKKHEIQYQKSSIMSKTPRRQVQDMKYRKHRDLYGTQHH